MESFELKMVIVVYYTLFNNNLTINNTAIKLMQIRRYFLLL